MDLLPSLSDLMSPDLIPYFEKSVFRHRVYFHYCQGEKCWSWHGTFA